jgi:ERCC4-type nuclease
MWLDGDRLILVSGAEPPELRMLGQSTNATEDLGVDFMFTSPAFGVVGIQRKAFPGDLLSSMADGRLGKELIQMGPLDLRILLVEGVPIFTDRGDLIYDYGRMNKKSLISFQMSLLAHHGVFTLWTQSLTDTTKVIPMIYEYCQNASSSSSLTARTRKQRWGDGGSMEYARFMAEGIPGLGRKRAQALVDKFNGLPIRLTATREELLEIEGIGPKMADSIIRALGGNDAS